MICNRCGSKINEGELFCGSCCNKITQNNVQSNSNTLENNDIQQVNNVTSAPKTNSKAIASLVFSLVAFFTLVFSLDAFFNFVLLYIPALVIFIFEFLYIPALVFGFVAKEEIKTKNEKGKGLATAGIIIGFIDLFLTALIVFLNLKSIAGYS